MSSLENPGPRGERLNGVSTALAKIGAGALDAVAAFLADPGASDESAQAAAWFLTQIDGEHGPRPARLSDLRNLLLA